MKVIKVNNDNRTAIIKENNTYSVVNNDMKKTELTLDAAISVYGVLQKETINK